MTRATPTTTYDEDFFAWTQEQAAALRRMSSAGGAVDIAHIAEEIEDLGKRDLREVASYLSRLIEHLIKINLCRDSIDRPHWVSEAQRFQDSALAAYTRTMFRLLDLEKIWRRGSNAARRHFDEIGSAALIPSDCPFSLEDVLAVDFDLKAALAKLAAARAAEGHLDRR